MADDVRLSVLSDDRIFCEQVLRVFGDLSDGIVGDDGGSPPPTDRVQDITILDARMSDALRWCAALSPRTSVIVVGAPDSDMWAEEALSAGARGILTKSACTEDLAKALHTVVDGGIWARRRWLNASLQAFTSRNRGGPPPEIDALLSEREREVFHGAAMGLGNKEIADRLAISEATVKVHLTHIFHKVGVSGRAELAALYHGLLGAPNGASRRSGVSVK